MTQEVMVDMGKYELSQSPNILISLGLGSCVGIALYSDNSNISGLAHIMLPNSEGHNDKGGVFNMDKFANIAIPNMINDLEKKGLRRSSLKAKIAGGAHMFASLNITTMDIGKNNVEAVKKILNELNIPIVSEDTLGTVGRTIRFDIERKILIIKTKDGIHEI
jgi:chemotaxis protein CheD